MFLTIVFVRRDLAMTLLFGRLVNLESQHGQARGAKVDRDGTLSALSWHGEMIYIYWYSVHFIIRTLLSYDLVIFLESKLIFTREE